MDILGDKIKKIENDFDYKLPKRLPVIIRLDGRAFSKFTKKFQKPDYDFLNTMSNAMLAVASDIEGCVFGYTQSDEVTLVLKNNQSLLSEPWFDNRIQKICSISAAEMTYYFNKFLPKDNFDKAVFDARVFTVNSVNEMIDVICWRQKNCFKNSVSLAAYEELSKKYGKGSARKLLENKTTYDRIILLKKECDIDFFTFYKSFFVKGTGCYRVLTKINENLIRNKWIIDYDLPSFFKDSSLLTSIYENCKKNND